MKVDRGLILAAVIAVVLGVTACSVDTFMPKGPEEQPPEEIDEGGTTENCPLGAWVSHRLRLIPWKERSESGRTPTLSMSAACSLPRSSSRE